MHTRREFVSMGTALAVSSPAAVPLPRVKFFDVEITRLLVGSNQLYGYSHFNPLLDNMMRDWMTQDRRMQTLHMAEAAGINTWQVHYNDPVIEDFKRYRAEGGRMHWLLLADFGLMKDWKLIKEVVKLGPIGIAHHGNRTDERFLEGRMDIVHDFVKAVQDAGVPGGISTHNPKVVEYVEERGWKVDYYQTCMYWVTRRHADVRAKLDDAPLGELYFERDPERMCAMVRQTKKPCFAFKLLAAGRRISNPRQVEEAFRFALDHIKPTDAVIVGTFPKFKNEMAENAAIVRRVLAKA